MFVRVCTGLSLVVLMVILSAVLIGLDGTQRAVGERVLVASVSSGTLTVDAGARSAGVTEDWLGEALSRIEREEYRASINERGLQAPNRAHNLRTYFRDGGIEVVPRTSDAEDTWSLSWRTSSWGREGRLSDITATSCEPRANGPRVSYVREGFEEWYENKKEGVEQGFVVRERPEGEGLVCIEGRLGRGLRAELQPEAGAIDFVADGGARVLRYAELHVSDAEGREIPSYLRVNGNRVAILVDDAGATYPLTVDPLMTSPAWTVEGDQDMAEFGWSVGTAGDVNGDGYSDVVVGAPQYDNGNVDAGRAYVYHGSGSGLALSPAWSYAGGQSNVHFGYSVGTAGDVNGDGYSDIIVGGPFYSSGQTWEGKAWVFHGSSEGISGVGWSAEGNQAQAHFGGSVGTAGDVNGDGYSDVIVGAPGYSNDENLEGRAYVYYGSAEGLAHTANWVTESNQEGASFGGCVGTAGDVDGDGYSDVIVGASGYSNGQEDEGRTFVYHGSPSGLGLSPAWTAESNQALAYYGCSVGTAGDVNGDGYSDVIVGASDYGNGQMREGRAFVYQGSPAGLGLSPAWTAESDQADALFGMSVGTAGDVNGDGYSDVIVGAPSYSNGQEQEGRAYVYQGSAGGLPVTPSWTAENNEEMSAFGYSLGAAGDVNGDGYSDVIVGAWAYVNGVEMVGRAYVYHGSAGGLALDPGWITESNQADASFGISVGTAGDVNGDGYSDVIVGAHEYDNGQAYEGRAYLFYGSSGGLSLSAGWIAEGNQAFAWFGTSVGTAGDINGDGYSDVIVGAPGYSNGETYEGRAYVYHGSSGGLGLSPAWIAESNEENCSFGYSLGTAGDVNGDGYSDVIVGAQGYQNHDGAAFAYHGSAGGLGLSAAWTTVSMQGAAYYGCSVGTAGDVNGDGYSDVIVGARDYDNGEMDEGRAFVYQGSPAGLGLSPTWTAESDQADASFGMAVGTAGDVNGDGYSDVIVGAGWYDSGEVDEGRAFVYCGSPGGVALSPAWTAENNVTGSHFGCSVGTAGDVNGDGYSDAVVGAYSYGRTYVYHGSAGGLEVAASWTVESYQPDADFGRSVGAAGDVNGDGYSDITVGAPSYSNGQDQEGRAYVYYGNGGDGLHRIARQRRTDDSAPIAPLGFSGSPSYDGFALKVVGRTPAGRGNVRLQYEVKPLGTPFDGTGLVTGLASNTGAPGIGGSVVSLSEVLSGLTVNTLYHWRLRTVSDSPFFPRSPWFSLPYNCVTEADVRVGGHLVGIEDDGDAPSARLLARIAPNPFGTSTRFTYALPEGGRVRLAVYNVAGQQVALLKDGEQEAGLHIVNWDGMGARGRRLPSGVYFVQLRFGNHKEARKIVLTR